MQQFDSVPTAEDPGRVAIIAHSHPSISKGGAEIAAYTLFRGLLEIGVDAILIAACPEEDRKRLSLQSAREKIVFYDSSQYNHFYHLAHFDTARELHARLDEERVDLVNFHHFFNFGLSALHWHDLSRRPKLVFTLHEFLAICHHHGQMVTRPGLTLCEREDANACVTCFPDLTRQQFVLRKLNLLSTLKRCDGFVSPSTFLAERYVDWGLDADRMVVIENGLRSVSPKRAAGETRDTKTQWVFGFFGQINPFKGVDLLLNASETLKHDEEFSKKIQIRLHGNLVGQSDEFVSRLMRETKSDSPLTWLGPYDNSRVSELMQKCDYVVVPSRWWENSPVVIQEALAARRPVICTGIGGMAEKIEDGITGLHFRLNDDQDFIRVLQKACDPNLHSALCAKLPTPQTEIDMARYYVQFFDEVRQVS